MWFCYLIVNNFGFAIIIFTLIVKAAMFPLNLKQQKNMAKAQLFAPRVKEIQTKYKTNQAKQQEEMQKLQAEGYNPMGGCGSMLITFLLLFGVLDVVYKPMTHMEHLDWGQAGAITIVTDSAKQADLVSVLLTSPDDAEAVLRYRSDVNAITISDTNPQLTSPVDAEGNEISIDDAKKTVSVSNEDLTRFGTFSDADITNLTASTSILSPTVKAAMVTTRSNFTSALYRELNALKVYRRDPEVFKNIGLTVETIEKLDHLSNNVEFAGIDLTETPSFKLDPIILIPILAFILSFIQLLFTQKIQKLTNPDAAQMAGPMKIFMYIMPFFSLYISFILPAGAGFYWAISYLFTIAQSYITYKIFPPEKLREQAKQELELKSAKFKTTAVVTDVDDNGNEIKRVEKVSNLSQKELKEINKKKLEAARKADAEKYGEEYVDSNDD